MSEGWVAPLVTLILGIGGGIGFILRRRDNRKDPIPKQSAALAQANESVLLAGALRDEMRKDMAELRTEVAAAKEAAKSATKRVESLEETVETLDDSLTDAVRFIEALLRHLRTGSMGPAPAIPERLRGLIDPMLHRVEEPPTATV